MPYELFCWPASVSRKEIESLPASARAGVKLALSELARFGPNPSVRSVKNLGKKNDGLWQLSLKVDREQIRLLYFPWRNRIIVLVSAFKKTSPQLQQREYEAAVARKKEAERRLRDGEEGHGLTAIN